MLYDLCIVQHVAMAVLCSRACSTHCLWPNFDFLESLVHCNSTLKVVVCMYGVYSCIKRSPEPSRQVLVGVVLAI